MHKKKQNCANFVCTCYQFLLFFMLTCHISYHLLKISASISFQVVLNTPSIFLLLLYLWMYIFVDNALNAVMIRLNANSSIQQKAIVQSTEQRLCDSQDHEWWNKWFSRGYSSPTLLRQFAHKGVLSCFHLVQSDL